MSLPNASSCHHCHIHAPIPPEELKRTHPLRSGSPLGIRAGLTGSFRKNVSFLYRKFHGVSSVSLVTPPPPPPPKSHASNNRRSSSHCSHSSSLPHSLPHSTTHSLHSVPRSSPHHSSGSHSTHNSYSSQSSRGLPPALVIDSQPQGTTAPKRPLPPLPQEKKKRRGCGGLQAVLLVGAYALLLVLVVVVGVVLTQEQRRPGPRPVPKPGPLPVRVVRPRPRQQDLDYELEPNPLAGPPQQRAPAPLPPPRPVAPPPLRAPPPIRRPTFSTVDTDFSLSQQQQQDQRVRKEPEIKILKSWNNKNADGTLSWGYISQDGSFKNETRGHDCVVRGVYGYVEQETGKLLSFPYVSGNPCDPNAPDYEYDYYDTFDEFVPLSGSRARG